MRDFLKALWPEPAAGNLTIWTNPSRLSLHAPLAGVIAASDEDTADLHQINAVDSVYFGTGLRSDDLAARGAHAQGGKQDIICLPCFSLDVDFYHPVAHKAPNLPTVDDVGEIFGDAEPTIIVDSGFGWQVHFCFERPWVLDSASARAQAQTAFQAFQRPFIERGAARGWHVDSTATIQRVWRLPGFINRKTADNIVARVIYEGGPRNTPRDLTPRTPQTVRVGLGTAPLPRPVAPVEGLADVYEALQRYQGGSRDAVAAVLAGRSFAEPGGRDAALHRVCSTIAFVADPRHTPEALAEVLRPSLAMWAAEPGATKTVDEEVAKAVSKLGRARADREAREADTVEQHDALAGFADGLRANIERLPPRVEVDVTGAPLPPAPPASAPTPADMPAKHAIIQVRSSFWVWHFTTGAYVGPKIRDEILTTARDAWAPHVAPPGITLEYVNATGETKAKTLPRVMAEYGTVARDVLGKFALLDSYYDADAEIFVEAIAPLRVTDPVYDPQIDAWLQALAGVHYEKLCDWLAAVPQLDEQCCALYLDGVPGAGKGLLGAGLARLWRAGGPTPLENVLGNFNAEMFKCPFIMLDEGLPRSRGNVSADIRKIIGTLTHSYTEKFVVNRTVVGAVRLMIAANNDNVLAFGEENMTANDLQAIVGRFLRIGACVEATHWLEAHNPGNCLTRTWVDGDLIAKHVCWLALNRQIVRGKRFLVEGVSVDDMHRKLVMQGETAGLIYEWLARFTSNPEVLVRSYRTKRAQPLALVGDGDVLINAQGLIDGWSLYMGDDTVRPTTTKVGATLKKLGDGTRKLGVRNTRATYHKIRFDLVLGWAQDNQIGDEAEMLRHLATPLDLSGPVEATRLSVVP